MLTANIPKEVTGRGKIADRGATLLTTEDEPLRTLQRLFLFDGRCRKEVAARMSWDYDSLSRCINGQRDLPAKKLPALSLALQDPILFRVLLTPIGYLAIRRQFLPSSSRSAICILGDITADYARIHELIEKDIRGEKLTADELREVQERGEEIAQATREFTSRNRDAGKKGNAVKSERHTKRF